MIDKAPDEFPAATIVGWKREHKRCIEDVLGVAEYPDRASLRAVVGPILEKEP